MTKEERTKLINHLKYNRSIGADYSITDKDADEIIKALEQQDILDKIRAEIALNAYPIVYGVNNRELGMTLYGILEVIDKYKAESEDKE